MLYEYIESRKEHPITRHFPTFLLMAQALHGKACATFPAKALKGRNVGKCGNVIRHGDIGVVLWGLFDENKIWEQWIMPNYI